MLVAPDQNESDPETGTLLEHLVGDQESVEAVGDEINAQRRNDEPRGVNGFAPAQHDEPEESRASATTLTQSSFV